jgi:hypothetical protein
MPEDALWGEAQKEGTIAVSTLPTQEQHIFASLVVLAPGIEPVGLVVPGTKQRIKRIECRVSWEDDVGSGRGQFHGETSNCSPNVSC